MSRDLSNPRVFGDLSFLRCASNVVPINDFKKAEIFSKISIPDTLHTPCPSDSQGGNISSERAEKAQAQAARQLQGHPLALPGMPTWRAWHQPELSEPMPPELRAAQRAEAVAALIAEGPEPDDWELPPLPVIPSPLEDVPGLARTQEDAHAAQG